jgi:hypothetical protein
MPICPLPKESDSCKLLEAKAAESAVLQQHVDSVAAERQQRIFLQSQMVCARPSSFSGA